MLFQDSAESTQPRQRARLPRRGLVVIAMVAVGAASAAYAWWDSNRSPSPPAESADSHARMLALLDGIRQRTKDENPYLGEARLNWARSQMESATSPHQGFECRRLVALGLLNLGRVDESIEQLEQVENMVGVSGLELSLTQRRDLLFQLAVAHLRRGENENCVCCCNGESCLLPIQGGGIHQHPRGSRKAKEYLLQTLAIAPGDSSAIWLLNVACMTLGEYPQGVPAAYLIPPERFRSDIEFPRFPDVAPELGLNTFGLSGGALFDDFDGDGYLDLVTSTIDTSGSLLFFRNQGEGTFVDRSEQAGFTGLYGGLNLNQADYDNDGDLDVFVMRAAWFGAAGKHPNSLLQNDGSGRFRDVTFDAGLARDFAPTPTAAWADYDLDGDLDLYVGKEFDSLAKTGAPNQLFRNRGDGTFEDVTAKAGVGNERFTKGVAWGDFDNDRYPDLYVSNLDGENRLYHNQRNGTFIDMARALNVASPIKGFACWFWDFDNDGALDIFATSFDHSVRFVADEYLGRPGTSEHDRLYQGDGRGGFSEVSAAKNLARVTQPMGCNFGDINNDGYPDFYLGTGYPELEGLMPNLMYLNQRGETFADVSIAGGFAHLQKGHGVAFADWDNDHDQDVFVQLGGGYAGDVFRDALFQNPGFDNNSITIQLRGENSNRFGVGCRIRCEVEEAGETRSIFKWVNSGGSFGANPLRQQIGLGRASVVKTLEVYWPTTDQTQTYHNVPGNQFIEIREGRKEFDKLPFQRINFAPASD